MTAPGHILFAKGAFTQIKYVAGVNRFDLERHLGFNAGTLAGGWTLAALQMLPGPDAWTFRRFTRLVVDPRATAPDPDDGPAEDVEPPVPDTRSAEEWLADHGHDVAAMKADVMQNAFGLTGDRRLVKVIPAVNPCGQQEYYERGAPQWWLTAPFPMQVLAKMGPDEIYPKGSA